jgi:hypothetical protein
MSLRRPGLLAVCLLLLGGCAGYRLGPTNGVAAGEQSIRVNPFTNHTLEPRLGDAVTTALRNALQRDGTYHLATSGSADILVNGVISHYDRRELSFLPNDVLTVQDYRVSLTAEITAREAATGRLLFKGPVKGYALVRVGSDLPSAERQAVPLMAEDLARNVTGLLVDGSW